MPPQIAALFQRAIVLRLIHAGGQRDRPFDRLDDVRQRDRRRRPGQPQPAARSRDERSKPAAVSLLTSFWTVGTGSPVSSASFAAETLARCWPTCSISTQVPQCRAAADITTTA